jgi:four helix bundle protein
MKKNIISEKSFQFSLTIIDLCAALQEKREFVISKQLLRSATSIGANVRESSAAHSKKDFISKLTIASKEARETQYWLELLNNSSRFDICLEDHLKEIDEIIRILSSIIITLSRSK